MSNQIISNAQIAADEKKAQQANQKPFDASAQIGKLGTTLGFGMGNPYESTNSIFQQQQAAQMARQNALANLQQQWQQQLAAAQAARQAAMEAAARRNQGGTTGGTLPNLPLGPPKPGTLPNIPGNIPGNLPGGGNLPSSTGGDFPGLPKTTPDLPPGNGQDQGQNGGQQGQDYKQPLWAQLGKPTMDTPKLNSPLGFSSGLGTNVPLGMRTYNPLGSQANAQNPWPNVDYADYNLNDPKMVMPQGPWDPRYPTFVPGADKNQYYAPQNAFKDVNGNWIDALTGQILDPSTFKTMTNDVRTEAAKAFWDWKNGQPNEDDLAQAYLDWLNQQNLDIPQMDMPYYPTDYGGYGGGGGSDYTPTWSDYGSNYSNFFKALYWRVGE